MKRSTWGVFVCLISMAAIVLSGCGGGTKAVSIVLSSGSTSAIDDGQTLTINANVSNDAKSMGVTWTLSGPGSLSGQTATSVIYKTPSAPIVGRRNAFVAAAQTATVTATSAADTTKTAAVTITVNPPPTITTTQAQVPTGVAGTAYNFTFAATGGTAPLTWSASPALTDGLSLNSSTGAVTGTPTAKGTITFTLTVTDSSMGSSGSQSSQASFTITINNPPAPTITTTQAQVTAGVAGTAYSFTFHGTGSGTLTWTATGLPADGLSLNSSTGAVAGTPTAKATVAFTLTLSDAFGQSSPATPFTITINNPPAPTITTTQAQVPAGVAKTAYSFTFQGTGSGTLTWSAVPALTDGLSLNSSTGAVTGTPTAKATVAFSLTLSDTFGQSSAATPFTITINNPPAPTITTTQAQVPSGIVGTPYNFTFQGTGTGTLTWSAVPALTDGLSLNSSTGAVTGTPAAKATIAFTLTLSDTFGQSSAATPFTITVNNPPPPVITTTQAQVPSAVVNVAYSFTFQATGFGTLTWSVSPALTDSLSLNTSTGTISGTPTTQATVSFNLTVTDSLGQSSAATPFTITVSSTTITFTQAPPSSVAAGSTAVNVTATVTNDPGNGGVDWTLSCGGGSCGSITAHTASAAQNSWTPPGSVPPSGSVTITAAVNDFPTVTVAATVTITAPAIVVVFNPAPPSSVATNSNTNLTATVSNDPGTAGVDWTVTCGSAGACGSFNPTHTASGSATVYTAPPGVPTGNTVTIAAASTTTPSQKATATVTITSSTPLTCPLSAGGNESLLNGTYAALFNGFNDGKGMFQAAASFTATGSSGTTNISSVVVDANGVGQTPQNLSGTGCYSVGSDRRGTMIWNFSPTANVVFAIAVRSNGNGGRLIEFDDSAPNPATGKTRGSGSFKKQTAAAFAASTLNGNLAVGVRGSDSNRNRNGVGAVLTADGVSTITSGTADIEFASSTGPATFVPNATVTGTFTAPDATHGRGTVTLSVTVPVVGVLTLHFAYYVIDTTQMFVQSTDTPDAVGHALQNGLMGKQSGGPFSNASLNGSAIFSLAGVDPSSTHAFTDTAIGLVTSTGNGSFTGVLDQNVNAVVTHNGDAISGTVSIGSNGLGTLTITSPTGIPPFTIVMVAPNTALMLGGASGSPNNNVPTGFLQAQTGGGSFTGTSVNGTLILGSDEPVIGKVKDDVGAVTAAFPNLTITQDSSSPNGLQSGKMMSGTYTMTSNGRGVVTITGTNGGTAIIWLSQTNKAVILVQGDTFSAILNIDQ